MAVPDPITRLEKYWAAILDKIQGGGSAPVLEPLTATENGTYTPDPGVDGFDRVIVRVEQEWQSITVTGTLDAPFAFEDYLSLDMADKIYAIMAIDATAIGAGNVTVNLDKINTSDLSRVVLHFSACNIPTTTVSDVIAADVVILVDTNNDSVRFGAVLTMQQGAIVDVSQYASLMPTTTTFVYHKPVVDD
jgi:hypothetical protein